MLFFYYFNPTLAGCCGCCSSTFVADPSPIRWPTICYYWCYWHCSSKAMKLLSDWSPPAHCDRQFAMANSRWLPPCANNNRSFGCPWPTARHHRHQMAPVADDGNSQIGVVEQDNWCFLLMGQKHAYFFIIIPHPSKGRNKANYRNLFYIIYRISSYKTH